MTDRDPVAGAGMLGAGLSLGAVSTFVFHPVWGNVVGAVIFGGALLYDGYRNRRGGADE